MVWLMHRARRYQLRLPLALRILFDYLARHHSFSQSAMQIEIGIRLDPFYARHGANAGASRKQTRTISHSAVKVYIQRLRQAFRLVFDEVRLDLDPSEVLLSESTVGNEVGYKLKATVTWSHI